MSLGVPPLQSRLIVDGKFASWPQPWANWFNRANQILFSQEQFGISGQRPTNNLWISQQYFDTTLGFPIWWDGAQWVDATGAPA